MAIFNYKAIDQEGAVRNGIVEAETIETAQGDLTHQGLNILDIKPTGRFTANLKGLSGKSRGLRS